MRHILALLLACSPMLADSNPSGKNDVLLNHEKPVLVLVDIQNFYFPGGKLPLTGSLEAAKQAASALGFFRKQGCPVIHVRHEGKPTPEEPDPSKNVQYKIHDLVKPLDSEQVITKHHVNSFQNTALLESLKKLNATSLVIIGMQTHMCLEGAVRAATDFGFKVTVLTDAVATRPLKYNGIEASAPQVHTTVMCALSEGYGATLLTTESYIKQNDK